MANSYQMSGPHIRQVDSIEKTMWNVVLALIPAIFMAVYLFGSYALYLVAATMITCMVVEIPFNKNLSGRQRLLGDGSAAVTGVILGLSLPPTAPWWIPILGGIAAILVGKQLFGGLGNNVFNPALVGRAILSISWTIYMTQWVTPFDGLSTSTPLATPGPDASLWELFAGTVPGSIGETSAIALLIGAAYLYYRGYLDLRISIPYVVAAAATALILGINPLYAILAGSLIMGAFFIATDMVTSPATRSGRLIYGAGCGILTIVIRAFTGFPEGVTFAILLMNGFSHLFDTLFEGYIFGQIHLKKRRIMQAGVIVFSTILFAAIAFGGFQLSDRDFLEPQHRVFNEYKHEFFPQADGFNMLEELHRDRMLAEVTQGNRRVGFLAYTQRIGYDGEIENMVAINPDGEVIGSRIIDHNESATTGAQIEREDFLAQFVGLRYEDLNPTLEGQEFNLDTITNATLSSIAVAQTVETSLELVNRQLEGSRYDYFDLPTGRYRGTGTGWGGEMEVEVVIEDGFLMDLEVQNHSDTPHKARSAFERLKSRVISAQSTDVDTISGSTASSRGMLEAIEDALASREVVVEEVDFSELADGIYTGSAPGHIDEIEVEIEIADGEVVNIDIVSHEETTYLAEPALERLIRRVISEQTTGIEMVSGATLTSRGFLAAVADAGIEEEPFVIPDIDGTFTGISEGYQDDVEVEVTLEAGDITNIEVISHRETEDVAEPAFEELKDKVIEAQDTDVDKITGATYSSQGYLGAVENALRQIAEPDYEDGVYTAIAEGYQSDIEIELVIEEGEIEEISVISHDETSEIADPAFDDLEEKVIDAQSAEVDTISGATGTSEGYLDAVSAILTDARTDVVPEEPEPEEVELQDGEFTGTGEGYNDDIEVEVRIQGGEITAVEVLRHEETEDIAEPAFADLEEMVIEAQDTDVDTISGATGSSEGYLEAVDAALSGAEDIDEPEPEEPEAVFSEGTYTGIADGYNDEIEVEVTVDQEEIVDIEVVAHEETEDIAEPAFEDLISDVLEAQDTEVDTVTGATGSSEGFLEAVGAALDDARVDEPEPVEDVPEIAEPRFEMADGTYQGVAAGYQDDVEVEIVVDNGIIVGIEVIKHGDTPDIAEPAFEEMQERVVAAQDTESVDTVTEATKSSEGFLRAVNVAMTAAHEAYEEPEEPEPEVELEDGEFTGTGEGYNDDIEVEVRIEGGEITAVEVLRHEETEDIAEPAFADLEEMVIEAQDTDVDTISGATGSSEGYLEAVDAALSGAEDIDEPEPEEPEAVFSEGTYTGIADGYNDEIEVEVTVDQEEIVDIEVVAHEETEDIAEPAFEDLISDVLEAQDTEVDTVTGATGSSEGFLEAVGAALDDARVDEPEPVDEPETEEIEEPEEPEPEVELEDGKFTGTGEGYNDDIEVEVSIEDGRIAGIKVLSHADTENIAELAFENLEERVIDSQDTDVDTFTAATGSSEGYLEAVKEALSRAENNNDDYNDDLKEKEIKEEPEIELSDGHYTGTGEGYSDEIEVEIFVDDGLISEIEVLSHGDSDDIAEPAFEDLTERVIYNQSADVDVVSGATSSSQGFLQAAGEAISSARDMPEPAVEYRDGSYTGAGEGYSDDIEVEVKVENGFITSIEVLSHGDSDDIAEPAFTDLTETIMEEQSPEIDTISGATGSSRGFLEAVNSALSQAKTEVIEVQPEIELSDGHYTGTGEGYSDEIEVEIFVDDGLISEIEVLSHGDSDDIAEPAFEDLTERVIYNQSADVDVVSGATSSSQGFLQAAGEAISSARDMPEPAVEYRDGSYTGAGEGYSDDIEVEVKVENGFITSIEVLSHGDSDDIAEPAFTDLTETIMEEQSPEIDTISGATGSSRGFLEAVNSALSQAKVKQ